MATKKKLPAIVVGSVVAFNELPDTYWFDVLEIDGFTLKIREEGKPNYREQYMDKSLVRQVKSGMGWIIPSSEEAAVVRVEGVKLARREGAVGKVEFEPGHRFSTNTPPLRDGDGHINALLVDASEHWDESDLFDHGDWKEFLAGFEAAPGGKAEVDFYISGKDSGLACNMTAVFDGGKLVKLECTNYAEGQQEIWTA